MFPFNVLSNGRSVTNWVPNHVIVEDDSGNTMSSFWRTGIIGSSWIVEGKEGLNPWRNWRISATFERAPEVGSDEIHQLPIPSTSSPVLTTNIAGMRIRLRRDRFDYLRLAIPTNHVDRALKFLTFRSKNRGEVQSLSIRGGQHHFIAHPPHLKPNDRLEVIEFAITPAFRKTFLAKPTIISPPTEE